MQNKNMTGSFYHEVICGLPVTFLLSIRYIKLSAANACENLFFAVFFEMPLFVTL